MSSDDEYDNHSTIKTYHYENYTCNKCSFSTDSWDHYNLCEYDHAAVAAAKKWCRFMELQDQAIDEYLSLRDDSYDPGNISIFIKKYFIANEFSWP